MVYRIGEALRTAGVSRATYFRWVQRGRIADARYRDRNGRRVFTDEDIRALKDEAKKLLEDSQHIRMQLEGVG